MNKVLSHVHQCPISVCTHRSLLLFSSTSYTSSFLSSPHPFPCFALISCSLLCPALLIYTSSFPIPVSVLPCSVSCNLSVISLHVFMKSVCFGEYGFMLARFTVCNEQATLNHNSNDKYLIQSTICIEFIVIQRLLSLSLCPSMTTRVVTSATCQSISPWCGMETLSSTTRSTFKV